MRIKKLFCLFFIGLALAQVPSVTIKAMDSGDNPQCPICFDEPNGAITRVPCCRKTIHKTCLDGCLAINKECPFCQVPLTKNNWGKLEVNQGARAAQQEENRQADQRERKRRARIVQQLPSAGHSSAEIAPRAQRRVYGRRRPIRATHHRKRYQNQYAGNSSESDSGSENEDRGHRQIKHSSSGKNSKSSSSKHKNKVPHREGDPSDNSALNSLSFVKDLAVVALCGIPTFFLMKYLIKKSYKI